MPKIKGEDLSSLYPYPKSFDELEAERKLRELTRRPRLVSIKIGAWTTLSAVILLVAYQTCSHLIVSSLSSAGTVIFGVFTSMLIGLAAVAAVFYLYSLINHLATKVLTYPRVHSNRHLLCVDNTNTAETRYAFNDFASISIQFYTNFAHSRVQVKTREW